VGDGAAATAYQSFEKRLFRCASVEIFTKEGKKVQNRADRLSRLHGFGDGPNFADISGGQLK